jgi:AbrB family looped-hinge helix DNA binding protein
MAQKVKSEGGARGRAQTKVSSKHQVTIPVAAFRGAGLKPGDTLRVEAEGAGRIVLTRVEELLDRYSGCLDSGGALRAQVEGLRKEWR